MATSWEYKIVPVDNLYAENLNASGKDGWELVSVQRDLPVHGPSQPPQTKAITLIFKRPKQAEGSFRQQPLEI